MQIDGHFISTLDWADLCRDAKMDEVIEYLKKSKHLQIPADVAAFIPWEIVDPIKQVDCDKSMEC